MSMVRTLTLLAVLTALFMTAGFLIGGEGGALIALVIAAGMNLWAFWNSGASVLRRHGAHAVTERSHPELHAMTAQLARNAGLPMPALYVIEQDQPNAFATGRNAETGAVAVTTGLMRTLNREELAGVIAHELAHIRNRDTLIMTVAATLGGAIGFLAQFGLFFGGGRDRGPLGIAGVLLAAILAPLAAMLIQMTISRTREYAADRAGAEICGNPIWLAGALAKIAGGGKARLMESAERDPSSAHMFIVNPLAGRGMDNLFSTHPATENRIAALQAMAAETPRGPRAGAAPGVRPAPPPGTQVGARPGSSRIPPAGARRRPPEGPWG